MTKKHLIIGAGILALILIIKCGLSADPAESFIVEMEKISSQMTTLTTKCENGKLPYSEYRKKMAKLLSEIEELGEKYTIADEDMSAKQKTRLLKVLENIEALEERNDRLELKNYYD